MPETSASGVVEHELPGIGRRYDLGDLDGTQVSVVIHHSGRRDVYVLGQEDEPVAVLSLTDGQARRLGAILSGAYFQPAVVTEIEAAIGELLIDWVTVEPYSPAVGRSIAELEIRRRTGMTVAAVLRNGEPLVPPEPTEVLRAGDQLVVVGRRQDLSGFLRAVIGSPDG